MTNTVTHIEIDIEQQVEVNLPRAFSFSTLKRFEEIAAHIQIHKNNISYLKAVASGEIDLSKTGCTDSIRCYQRTKEDEARLPRTLANLQQQIDLLHHEQEVLQRYGR
jgi:hypothetical protein